MSPCPHRVHVHAWQGGLGRRVLFAPWAPTVPILGGSSMAGWFGTSLGASDTPCTWCTWCSWCCLCAQEVPSHVPPTARLNSLLQHAAPSPVVTVSEEWGQPSQSLAHIPGSCPSPLPACCNPTNPSRHPVSHARALGACQGGDISGSRSSLCRLGCS